MSSPVPSAAQSRLTLRQTLLAAMLGVVLISAGLVGALALYAGRHAVRDQATAILGQSMFRVEDRIQQIVGNTSMFNHLINRLMDARPVSSELYPSLTGALVGPFEHHRDLSFVGIGIVKTGEYWLMQRLNNGEVMVRECAMDASGVNRIRIHRPTTVGNHEAATVPWDGFDFRRQSGFARLETNRHAAWLPVHLFEDILERKITPSVSFAAPIHDAQGQLKAVLDLGIDMVEFAAYLQRADHDSPGHVFVTELEPGGAWRFTVPSQLREQNLATPGRTSAALNPLSDVVFQAVLDQQKTQPVEFAGLSSPPEVIRAGGQALFVLCRRLAYPNLPPWVMVSVLPQSELMDNFQSGQRWALLLIGIAVVGAAILATGVSRWVALPLRRLQECATMMAAGQLDHPVRVAGPMEITQLATAFNVMAENTLARRKALLAANDAMREAEHKYRELLESANSIILRLNRQGEIIFMNEFGQKFFGYSEAELLGRSAVGTIVPATESTGRNLSHLLDDICQNPAKYERSINENRKRDNELAWIDWNNKAIRDRQGQLLEILCIGADVTAQRHAEAALRESEAKLREAHDELELRVRERTTELSIANLALRTESDERLRAAQVIERLHVDLQRRATELVEANARLQELDRLKSEFLATMSHELRTPLNSIIGFTGILRQGLAGPINEEQAKQLGIVYGSAKHLLSLINDLLDLSRIEAGKIDLDRKPFNFIDTVAEVVEGLQPMAQQKQLALLTELPAPVVEMVGDRKRCYQVLLNLANNAIKFTEHGEVRITVRVDGDRLQACVADTGIGIKPEHTGMLFEAFRQVDGSARRVYDGTGLGLHLCRKLLEMMGGHIEVDSEYGRGSRFTFNLPLKLTNHESPKPKTRL